MPKTTANADMTMAIDNRQTHKQSPPAVKIIPEKKKKNKKIFTIFIIMEIICKKKFILYFNTFN